MEEKSTEIGDWEAPIPDGFADLSGEGVSSEHASLLRKATVTSYRIFERKIISKTLSCKPETLAIPGGGARPLNAGSFFEYVP